MNDLKMVPLIRCLFFRLSIVFSHNIYIVGIPGRENPDFTSKKGSYYECFNRSQKPDCYIRYDEEG